MNSTLFASSGETSRQVGFDTWRLLAVRTDYNRVDTGSQLDSADLWIWRLLAVSLPAILDPLHSLSPSEWLFAVCHLYITNKHFYTAN